MARGALRASILLALSVSLAGCAEVPFLGTIGETFGGVMQAVRAAVDPLIGSFLPPMEEASPTPGPRPRTFRRAPALGAVATQNATAAVEDPRELYARWAARNREFDRLRTLGLIYLYDGDTRAAIDHFRQAQNLRPHDQQIAMLLNLATQPAPRKRAMDMGLGDGPPALPQPQAPGGIGGFLDSGGAPGGGALPPGIGDVLKNLPQGGGDKPGKLF